MKPTDTSSVSLQSSLLLQKTTSKFMPLITIQNKNVNKKQYDYENETENDMTDNLDEEDDDDDSMHQQQQTSPNSTSSKQALNTNSPNFERKRTANLENLIGNLKVRKLNQTTNSKYNKMTSLYVDIAGAGAQSMSDCSPSTPPLSSPSVSPSSISIASDSPNHASSFSSSSSSVVNQTNDNRQRYSMVPKFRWIIESGSDYPQNDLKSLQNQAAALSGFDPIKLNEIMNESSSLWLNNEQQVKTPPTKPVKLTKKQQQKLDKPVHKPGSLSTGHKNQEDPSRQIKFYDDFIDFRGDVLRRPPDSKNCRILWEYLYLLLQNTNYSTVIRWEDETNMVFRIVQAEKLAALWGLQKNRLGMTYEKLSRGMRYYYPNNIIAREPGRRLLYRFMRHPDEIKKFVKKNGTYMLKRAKMNAKNSESMETINTNTTNLDESIRTDLNPDDSGVDEPGSINKSKQSKKKTNDTLKNENNKNKNHSTKTMSNNIKQETNNDNEDEYPDEQVDEEIEDEDLDNLGDSRNRDDSTVDEEAMEHNSCKKDSSSSSSPYSGSISHENNTINGEMKTNTQAAAALFAAAANAMTGANRLYPDFNAVNDLFQYYAAAAGLQQQSPSMASTYLSRIFNKTSSQSNKDDVHAAQSLMQLKCNQNDNQLNFSNFDTNNNNHFLSETIKNFTNLARNNIANTNMQKTKRSSVARSNDLSSASSTSSNSSLEHSIDYENNNEFRNQARKINKQPKMEDLHSNYEYPLNLSVANNNNNIGNNNVKKRKSKYDTKVNDI